MIAHVAEAGEGRGRVVLQVTSGKSCPIALDAAIRVAQAFHSEIESVFVEDTVLLDAAGFTFAREVSFAGARARALSRDTLARQMQATAAEMHRRMTVLASRADVPLHVTVVRGEPIASLASACQAKGPWNVVVLAEPIAPRDRDLIARLFFGIPDTTGLVLVGPMARRSAGRIVGIVEDIEHFDAVLRTSRRMLEVSGEPRLTLLLMAQTEEEADVMDEAARLSLSDDASVEIIRARVHVNAPDMIAEIIRRLKAGFIVARFGGIVLPRSGNHRALAGVLECPLFLIR